jgi:hypothetical protein
MNWSAHRRLAASRVLEAFRFREIGPEGSGSGGSGISISDRSELSLLIVVGRNGVSWSDSVCVVKLIIQVAMLNGHLHPTSAHID